VPENAEITVSHEPRKLGLVGKATVVFLTLATVVLVAVSVVALRAKYDADEKRQATLETLAKLVDAFKRTEMQMARSRPECPWPFLDPPRVSFANLAVGFTSQENKAIRDSWGNPIYYRCPGPIHKNGFDLISCGPNGVYEEGGGDDIVVGEDLPVGIAAISSESGTATNESK